MAEREDDVLNAGVEAHSRPVDGRSCRREQRSRAAGLACRIAAVLAAYAFLQPSAASASGSSLPIEPTAMIDHATHCMLVLGGADHFFQDKRHRRQGRFDERHLAELKPAWNQFNAALAFAYDAAGWDSERRQDHFDTRRRTFWRNYLDDQKGNYRATKNQLLRLSEATEPCRAQAQQAAPHATRLREYQRFATCAAVARPLADRMAVEPEYGAGLGVSVEQVAAIGDQALEVLESLSNRLGHSIEATQRLLDSRMEDFWIGPDPEDGTTLGDRVLEELQRCAQDLDLRRAFEISAGQVSG